MRQKNSATTKVLQAGSIVSRHSSPNASPAEDLPRGILRVPEVLLACTATPQGGSLAAISKELALPKTSVHRLLRALEHGGYLEKRAGFYVPGPASFHLAHSLTRLRPEMSFPAIAQSSIEWLAGETRESVMLSMITDDRTEVVYVASIDSTEPLRYTLPVGGRRPLYQGASGKIVLAYMPEAEMEAYFAAVDFVQMTPSSITKADLHAGLDTIRKEGRFYDRNGSFEGASGLATAICDRAGTVFACVSVAGPTDRIDGNMASLLKLLGSIGERISRSVGYMGVYPPPWPATPA
jgi:IclR family transcriptional regulator, acetate operon repressor